MFLILPHSAEVQHGKIPWVVTTIALFCILICYLQEARREAVNDIIVPYCERIHDDSPEDNNDFLSKRQYGCVAHLTYLHDLPDRSRYNEIMRHWWESLPEAEDEPDGEYGDNVITPEDLNARTQHAYRHYEAINGELPPSLDRKLVYDPTTPNPIRAITSSLSHGDWWHLIGNLIFFFAFAPALEYIIASSLRFSLALLGLTFSVALADSLATLLGSPGNITLGLSGVVSGTIGMSAYLMPNIRIRTFVWLLHFAKNIPIPAWFLAVWYIGWDIYYLTTSDWLSGVNFLAHVAGGVSGYFIARFFFRKRREETRDEVDDEVAYMTAKRQDKLGLMSSYKSKDPYLANALRQEQANKAFERTLDRIHQAVSTGNDALAINIFLESYEEYRHAIELYEQMYEEMLKWPSSRALLCLSRLLISEYIASRKYARAIQVAVRAYAITDEFVFANDKERELLEVIAQKQGLSL